MRTSSVRRRLGVVALSTAALLPALVPLAGVAEAATAGLDPAYGSNGIVTLTQPNGRFGAYVTVVSNGVTYVLGTGSDSNFDSSTRIYARDEAGKPVAAFSGDGVLDRASPAGESSDGARAAPAPGGGLFVFFDRFNLGGDRLSDQVSKLLSNGTLDTSYGGGDGIAQLGSLDPEVVTDIASDSAGRVYLAGNTEVPPASPGDPFSYVGKIARLNAAGVPDTSFGGGDGVAESALTGKVVSVTEVEVGPSDEFFFLQRASSSTGKSNELVKLNETGEFDTTFGGTGKVVLGPDGAGGLVVSRVAPNVGAVVVGIRGATESNPARLLRLTAAGAPDTTFSTDGFASLPLGGRCFPDYVRDLVEDPLGRLIALRDSCPSTAADPVRVSPTGTVDATYKLVNGLDEERYFDVDEADLLPSGALLLTDVEDSETSSGASYVAKVLGDVAAAGSTFVALSSPKRILDTRSGAKVGTTKLDLQVTGQGGVPAGATAVVMNVTAVAPSGGFITVWPAGEAKPGASNINTTSGNNIPNLVVAKIGTGGKVSLQNSTGTTHLLADVAGYYSKTAGEKFTPVAPVRLLDTRPGAMVGAKQTRSVTVTGGASNVPLNVSAVVVNVTGVAPTADTFVTVFPKGTTRPSTSNLNLKKGINAPNLVTVKVANGGISLYNDAGATDLLVDIAGYYSPGSANNFVALSPFRQLNTTNATGIGTTTKIAGPGTITLDTSVGGVPLGATAVVLNVVAVSPTASNTFVTVFPTGTTRPSASNLNITANVTRANLVVVKVGTGATNGGKVSLYLSGGQSHLIADVAGYFVE